MKAKKILVILVIFVGSLMLMQSVLAVTGPPIIWANQATLSQVDDNPSQDPENSGFGTVQVVVWEEWDPINSNWDIHMNYSLLDGAAGSWITPPTHPATTAMDERNASVTVTRDHFYTGQEIHVVYQRWNPAPFPGHWDICHTYTNNFGVTWSPVVILNTVANRNAKNPGIVYTEDLAPGPGGGGVIGFLIQFVWAEDTGPPGTNLYDILYNAYYFDPTLVPIRGYIGPTTIRTNPTGLSCYKPEIASVDERINFAAYDYYFAIVWEEEINLPPVQLNVWYVDGTSQTSGPGGMFTALTPGSIGQINPLNAAGDAKEPDIAATQDYQANETYYFHIDYVNQTWTTPPVYSIESHYSAGFLPTPGAISFIMIVPAVQGPLNNIPLDNPTIASKLISVNPVTVFETWFCWEDWSIPAMAPDIYYAMGQYTGGIWAYLGGPARVPYIPLGQVSFEYNPELWNRNDATRMFPPVTHLVFDQDLAGTPEIIYIDP